MGNHYVNININKLKASTEAQPVDPVAGQQLQLLAPLHPCLRGQQLEQLLMVGGCGSV